MRKIILLLITVLICFSPVAYSYYDDEAEVESFTWEEKYVEQLQQVNIPVYIPSYVATSQFSKKLGHLFVRKIEVSKNHYLINISRQRVHDGKPRMLTFDVLTMSAGTLPAYLKQPFATYEMFENPDGTTKYNGHDVDYFSNKKVFIWKKSGWEYLVWAENTNNAINIMKRVMTTTPNGESPVEGAIKGQFTAYDTDEGVRSDAGWSYDEGKTWYIITGRTTPEQLVKVLQSVVKINTN